MKASVHTVAAGDVQVGWAPSLPTEADRAFLILVEGLVQDGSAVLGISDRENVETMYDSKPDFSLPNLGSGKKVSSVFLGLLLVVARRSVIIAGLSGFVVSVACLTVEPSGVKVLVDAAFEGSVHLLGFFSVT